MDRFFFYGGFESCFFFFFLYGGLTEGGGLPLPLSSPSLFLTLTLIRMIELLSLFVQYTDSSFCLWTTASLHCSVIEFYVCMYVFMQS